MSVMGKIVRRNADGTHFHHGAPVSLFRDEAPTGSVVGGIGESSAGYSENNRTNRPVPQGRIGGTDPTRGDAIRSVLCCWNADAETEIVEQNGLKYLLLWTPLQSGEGSPEGATTSGQISRAASTMIDPEQTFSDPPVGPRTAQDARIANTFARLRSHNEKPTPQAKRALTNIRKNADALGSIADANREFWDGKK